MTDGNNAEPNALKNKLQQQASKMQQSNSKLGPPESREESTERDGVDSLTTSITSITSIATSSSVIMKNHIILTMAVLVAASLADQGT